MSYTGAVKKLSETNVNAPGYVIVCNHDRKDEENGVVLVRSRENLDHKEELTQKDYE